MNQPQGIAGLQGKEPVGAVLTAGLKNERGHVDPRTVGRYYVVSPKENANRVRPPHPDFDVWNSPKADVSRRQTVRGVIVHARASQAAEWRLSCQTGPGGMHPDRRPFCVGDGVRAVRWTGKGPDDFQDIECPHDRCEFRVAPGPNKPVPCAPFGRLLFMLSMPKELQQRLLMDQKPQMPEVLCKFTTKSWRTVSNIKGFFDYIEGAAGELGLESYSLYGYPFEMSVTMQTKASAKARFPVTSFSPTMEPAEFFYLQREKLRAMQAPVMTAITDASEQEPETVYLDHKTITVPSE